jgi:FtsP/CotA-like multicopper oxidase with cupredoxin domain
MNWESRVTVPDGKIARYQQGNNVRYFKLVAQPIKHNILSNVTIKALGYNESTPGPLIIIKQGEWIFLEVENRMDEPTALHVHGLSKPNSQDGIPAIEPTPLIKPGESYTYKFVAWQAGTFLYHSSEPFQADFGLIGAFIVLPNEEEQSHLIIPKHDYVLLIQQWEIPQPELGKVFPGIYDPNKFNRNPNFFTINGKSFPDTSPLQQGTEKK